MLNGLGLMALVAVLYGTVERLRLTRTRRSLLHGLVFGCGAVAAMASPATPVPGILIDSRATFVAVAGAFVGPVAALIATALGGLYRGFVGGAGVVPGLVTLLIALAVGLVWRYAWYKRRPVTAASLVVLGAGISIQNLLILVLPIEMTVGYMLSLASIMTASALFATLVLCSMMNRENRIIAREKSLIDDAYTDPLTGLPNRRALLHAEASLTARSQTRGYAVLLVDVDHFKTVNDRFGHDAGDVALCALAGVLRTGTREGDIVSRFGGEEFVIALPATTAEEGWNVAERVLAFVREHRVPLPEAELALTVSIGFAHAGGGSLAQTIARADEALYRAKAEGRDRIVRAREPRQTPAGTTGAVPRPGPAGFGFATAQRLR